MICVWNIYEPCDPHDYESDADPFDIFLYALRREDAPLASAPIYIEGRRYRIVAVAHDAALTEVSTRGDEQYYKVCVVPVA